MKGDKRAKPPLMRVICKNIAKTISGEVESARNNTQSISGPPPTRICTPKESQQKYI